MLRNYQIQLAEKAYKILSLLNIVYLSMEMRVGKTLIALKTASLVNSKNVLFVTKKKAIQSIKDDYTREQFGFKLKVINYEQLIKEEPVFDLIIGDEAHCFGAFPKPSKRTMQLKRLVGRNKLILLSGTPSPESYSQLFHQFWVSDYSPFMQSKFYAWAKEFVNIKERIINGQKFNDYSDALNEKIMDNIRKYFVAYTRNEAGFVYGDVKEEVIEVDMDPRIRKLIELLVRDKMYTFKDGNKLICDTAVKLQSKIHQICSGTVKCEDGSAKILDTSKIEFIKQHYQGKKIAIYYKFIAEGQALRTIFRNHTDSPEEFNLTDKVFISQIVSGSMGINLASADVLVFYNIDFSATQYWQCRARLQALERNRVPIVHWIFSKDGIEPKIYKVVLKKKDYTLYYFLKDYLDGKRYSKQNNQIS